MASAPARSMTLGTRSTPSSHATRTSAIVAWPSSTSWTDCSTSSGSTPRLKVRQAWASRSTSSTRRPCSAKAAPSEATEVVLATPPFWLATATTVAPDEALVRRLSARSSRLSRRSSARRTFREASESEDQCVSPSSGIGRRPAHRRVRGGAEGTTSVVELSRTGDEARPTGRALGRGTGMPFAPPGDEPAREHRSTRAPTASPAPSVTPSRRSGRSLESLRRRLELRGVPVSIATLSYWQTGRSKPQRGCVARGAGPARAHPRAAPRAPLLTSGPGTPAGPAPAPRLTPRPRPGRRRCRSRPRCSRRRWCGWGSAPHQELLDLSTHDTLDLDDDGHGHRLHDAQRRARRRGTAPSASPSTSASSAQTAKPPRVRAVSGSRIGRHVAVPDAAVFVVGAPARPAAAGWARSAAAEYVITLPDGLDPEDASSTSCRAS